MEREADVIGKAEQEVEFEVQAASAGVAAAHGYCPTEGHICPSSHLTRDGYICPSSPVRVKVNRPDTVMDLRQIAI